MEKVSVVVPVYNVEAYLENCLSSIANQTYTNLEILVVDDGSKDTSGEIADRFANIDCRFLVIHKKNNGVSSARNTAIKQATGEYFCFVDADDYLELDAIQKRVQCIENNQVDICVEKNIFKNVELQVYAECPSGIVDREMAINYLLRFNYPNSLWAGMYKRKVIEGNLFSEKIHYWEDLEYQYKVISKADRIFISENPLYHYVVREGSANTWKLNHKVMSCLLIPESLQVAEIVNKKAFDALCFEFYRIIFFRILSSEEEIPEEFIYMLMKYQRQYAKHIIPLLNNIKEQVSYIFCCFFLKKYLIRNKRKKGEEKGENEHPYCN